MKRLLLIVSIITSGMLVYGQTYSIPSSSMRTLDGGIYNANEIKPDGRPLLIIFWDASDKNCFSQIESILSAREEILEKQDLRVIGICTDCNGDGSSVGPVVFGHDWEMEVYLDRNGDLKRSMNISYLPYTLLFDENMGLVCQYAGYCDGAGSILCEKAKTCLDNESITLAAPSP